MTVNYRCPVCGEKLKLSENSYRCRNRHCFDLSAKGYVNLLLTRGRNPAKAGDAPNMIRARSDFLGTDAYKPLADRLCETVRELTAGIKEPVVIDSGCGEGYYTVKIASSLKDAAVFGIDISKSGIAHAAALKKAAGCNSLQLAVASSFELPFGKNTADVLVSVFAPVSNDEYSRVLRPGGKLIVVSPTPMHLFRLKALIYDEPYQNKPNRYGLRSFELTNEQQLEYSFTLATDKQAADLFAMTPYYYKTSPEAKARLIGCAPFETEAGFLIQVFTKII
ncbi:MAG: methyltransferase domain-containing protein [Ruminococcus sp.]|nr:methyltransferase domain-containing protein [Ruminococcus sp.]